MKKIKVTYKHWNPTFNLWGGFKEESIEVEGDDLEKAKRKVKNRLQYKKRTSTLFSNSSISDLKAEFID